jgi:hypothetical protein
VHLPKNFKGNENTPNVRQQISFSSPTFFGWNITYTVEAVFAASFNFLGQNV